MDFTDKAPGEMMTLPEMQERAAGVQKGDIVFHKTGMDKHFKTPDWELQPYLAEDAMAWLIQEKAPHIIGTDASGFEVPGTEYQPNHLKMFQHGIAMIESATNLDALGEGRALCFVLPLRLKGVDACPVRIVAVREGGIIDG